MQRLRLIIPITIILLATGCASKAQIEYIGQCPYDKGHAFCGQVFTDVSACNAARKQHDRDTGRAGTCSRG